MYSIVLGICLLVESVSCMTIWKPDMPGNKYKMKVISTPLPFFTFLTIGQYSDIYNFSYIFYIHI